MSESIIDKLRTNIEMRIDSTFIPKESSETIKTVHRGRHKAGENTVITQN